MLDLKNLNKNDGDTFDNLSADLIDENFNKIKEYINNLNVPTRTKQLVNDSNFLTSIELTEEVINEITKFNENFSGSNDSIASKLNNLATQNKDILKLVDIILEGSYLTNEKDEILTDESDEILTL